MVCLLAALACGSLSPLTEIFWRVGGRQGKEQLRGLIPQGSLPQDTTLTLRLCLSPARLLQHSLNTCWHHYILKPCFCAL